jgi:hypothetical protein
MVGYARGWSGKARWGIALGVLLLAGPLVAKSSEASIPFANHGGIRDWRADGSKGMWIEAASGHWFYASFSSQCTTLPFAIGVNFVPEPSGVLSRWSSIRLAHDERCFFRTLQPSDAPPKKRELVKPDPSLGRPVKPTPGATSQVPAGSALDLASPAIGELLLSAPLQVFVESGNEPPAAAAMPEIVVEASVSAPPPSPAPDTPCGLASIAWSLAHPADAWRALAPLPEFSDADACSTAAAVVEQVPEALAPVRWYQ